MSVNSIQSFNEDRIANEEQQKQELMNKKRIRKREKRKEQLQKQELVNQKRIRRREK